MYVPLWVFSFIVLFCVLCVYMRTVLLPLCVNLTTVNKYIKYSSTSNPKIFLNF